MNDLKETASLMKLLKNTSIYQKIAIINLLSDWLVRNYDENYEVKELEEKNE